jgi:arabinose-5-phosphate isomerase
VEDTLQKVLKAIDIEIESITHFRESIGKEYAEAVELIFKSKGKLIVTGVGKSGDIAKKISSTLTSTGTPAFFLHPTDALHGDAGIIHNDDIILAIGKSGESDELLSLLPTAKRIGAKIIALTANPKSRLAEASDILLVTPVLKEACPLELAPTSSTTIALIAGDAIAMALMELKNFKAEDFALYHPAGRLGKRLSLSIKDVMRAGENNAIIMIDAKLPQILEEITNKLVGAVSVVNEKGNLEGFITDFDIRKLLTSGKLNADTRAKDIMNQNPIRFRDDLLAYEVLIQMEERNRPISVAPIVDSTNRLVGIISLHDLLQKGLK